MACTFGGDAVVAQAASSRAASMGTARDSPLELSLNVMEWGHLEVGKP